MAVTNNTYQQQQKQRQQAQPYTGLQGVSQNTAQQLGQLQSGYQPSAQVQQAQQNLQNVQRQKPGAFQSKYTGQLENILQQITNPGEFKYEFNGDNLFKNYADLYTQKGRQASLDAQGQAAALTGGYGNSYAQQVGQQAYQQNLLPLYDKGLELRDRAYGEYQDRIANNQNAYGLVANREATEYGRYRDTTEDWKQQEEQAYNRLKDAEASDFNKYQVMLGYYQGLAELENQDYRNEQEQKEAIRQFNVKMAENVREFDADLAERIRSNKAAEDYQNRTLQENQRQFDTQMAETKRSNLAAEDYQNRTLREQIRSNLAGEDYQNRTLAEQIRSNMAGEDYQNRYLEEQIRSNMAGEDYNDRALAETIRSNQAGEDYNNRALAETIRSNMAGETYNNNYLEYLYAALDAQYGDHGEGSGSGSSSGSGGSGGTGGNDGENTNPGNTPQVDLTTMYPGVNVTSGFMQGVEDVSEAANDYVQQAKTNQNQTGLTEAAKAVGNTVDTAAKQANATPTNFWTKAANNVKSNVESTVSSVLDKISKSLNVTMK